MWDGAFCWPYTAAGTLVVKPCPDYVHGFNPNATASKFCSENGTWWRHPDLNLTWTNYTLCGNGNPTQDDSQGFCGTYTSNKSYLSSRLLGISDVITDSLHSSWKC
ncbi:hypothetical protein TNIN_138391 [Trichonephila inaurata madagascariensis]|uniref:G-protein coupled receptors family 2 profile 1 domain-containing protein n=1 Tax=Trichonephila inaurata madagascariensis TaxID=2747483 RepID=A0A8X6K003_9ARAC|nr:hypothetical protein TNIN_138391 [Trichonephila inaurata madagascariensis]